jgi:hypothetical protein
MLTILIGCSGMVAVGVIAIKAILDDLRGM